MPDDLPELLVKDKSAWRSWLDKHCEASPGAWVVLAKKGTTTPTSLSYDQALDEALCCGWIDGQVGRRDAATYRQRFTPRRRASRWSLRNVELVEQLTKQGRMAPAGLAAMEAAKADGRWQAAYASPERIEVPQDLESGVTQFPSSSRDVRHP